MERKKLIRPITIVKVQRFLDEVRVNINYDSECNLDKLCRKHSIGGINGTMLVRIGWLLHTDIKHRYTFNDQETFKADELHARILIEKVRLQRIAQQEKNKDVHSNANEGKVQVHVTDEDLQLKEKLPKGSEIASILKKIEEYLRPEVQQISLLDEIHATHEKHIQIASAIATAVYHDKSNDVMTDDDYFKRLNNKIALASYDLLQKVLNFKKE